MIGILLITHQPLGTAFLQVLTHIFGSLPPNIDCIDVKANESQESVKKRIHVKVAQIDTGKGVLMMTDIVGATPSNCSVNPTPESSAVCATACVTGTNLPMILRAIHYRTEPLHALANIVIEGGHLSMLKLSDPNPARLNPVSIDT